MDDGVSQKFSASIELLARYVGTFLTPWTAYQVLIIAACLGLALVIDRVLTRKLETQLRRIQGQPTLMRVLVVPLRRLKWILWALILWATAVALREITWPSRSFFILVAAKLVGSWVAISVLSRSVRNREIARFLTLLAWPIAALAIVGLLDDFTAALDALALIIGDRRISALLVVKGILVFSILIWLASIAGSFAEQRISRAEELTPAYQVLASKLLKAILIILAVVLSLTAIGIDLTALAVFSGALGLGIGFGLQKIASNLTSGIIILMDRSIKPGDVISLGDTFGWIARLQSRYVSVITRDGVEHLIPNETFVSEAVINWSHSNRQVRLEIAFGTSYSDDPHRTRSIAVQAITDLERVLSVPKPVCHVVGFGESSIKFVLRFWIHDPENGITNISGQAYLAVWDVFKAHGIRIPFPHREVLLRTPVQIERKSDSE